MIQSVIWRCPSNIALVKYWGKKENQIPCNASLSMTLQNAFTETRLDLTPKKKTSIELEYLFEGKRKSDFELRILQYLEKYADFFPVLKEFAIHLDSKNSFPHSTGIASSASAFGALSLTLLSASGYEKEELLQKASSLSRLGSGSACRSMFARYALWGHLSDINNSSNEYAVLVEEVHDNFTDIYDAILIVEDTPKKVSSSLGHQLMRGHWYAERRFQQADNHCLSLISTLKIGDFDQFVAIIEQEALALHAMMMTSDNYYLLMKPGTIFIIESIMQFRKDSGIPLCFTLDAGPNVHVLYPGSYKKKVEDFLGVVLEPGLKGIIYDHIGKGPQKIIS